ncbi:MAG TPA: LysR family transcriptional regulator, partial [Pseudomonas sp.]|nr:LysR family transcriptional regulator [Pseudomonas sp.]
VTAQLQSLIPTDLRILGEAEGLPPLPLSSIVLLRNAQTQSPVTEALAEYIVDGFRQ